MFVGINIRDYCSRSEGAVSAAQSYFPKFSSNTQACTRSASGITLGQSTTYFSTQATSYFLIIIIVVVDCSVMSFQKTPNVSITCF